MAARWCPLCQRGVLGRHCETSPTCSWEHCPACRVTFNPHTRTAYDRDWRPVAWPKPA